MKRFFILVIFLIFSFLLFYEKPGPDRYLDAKYDVDAVFMGREKQENSLLYHYETSDGIFFTVSCRYGPVDTPWGRVPFLWGCSYDDNLIQKINSKVIHAEGMVSAREIKDVVKKCELISKRIGSLYEKYGITAKPDFYITLYNGRERKEFRYHPAMDEKAWKQEIQAFLGD